jgi:WD40 repeat protein
MGIRALLILTLCFLLMLSPAHAQDDLPVISPDNIEQLQELARYGDGMLLYSAAWSPDGNTLAIAGTLGVWLYNTQDWTAPATLISMDYVDDLAYSPDGTRLAVITADGLTPDKLTVLDTATHNELYQIEARSPVEWSPNGTLIATENGTAFGGEVIVWDAESGEQVTWATLITGPDITDIKFSADGSQIAAVGQGDRTGLTHYALWEMMRGIETGHLNDGLIQSAEYSDAREIGCCADRYVSTAMQEYWDGLSAYASHYVLSDDQQFIAYNADDEIAVIDQAGNRSTLQDTIYGTVRAFSPDNSQLVIQEGLQFSVWDIASGTQVADLARGLARVFSEYAVVTVANSEQLIDLRTGETLLSVEAREMWVSDNGTVVLVEYDDRTASVWDIATQSLLMNVPAEYSAHNTTLSPDGTRLLGTDSVDSLGGPTNVTLWDTTSGDVVQTIEMPDLFFWSQFSPSSAYVVIVARGSMTLLNSADGSTVPNLPATNQVIADQIAFSQTHVTYTIESAPGEFETHLWRIGSSDAPTVYTGSRPQFSRDEQLLYIYRANGNLDAVDVERGMILTEVVASDSESPIGMFVEGDERFVYLVEQQGTTAAPLYTTVYFHEFEGEVRPVHQAQSRIWLMQFSRDNNLFIVLDGDRLYFFDGHNGAWLWEMQHVDGASFSSDGTRLYIVSDNRTVRVYGIGS